MLPVDALKAGAAGLFVGLVLGGFGLHQFYAPRLELERTRVGKLSEALEAQNKAVERLQEADRQRAAAAKKAIEAARREAEQAQADAMDILTRQPEPGVDRCTAASALVRQELGK